jgi:phosphopantothenoylcysteine decarboxylase/phosphopantothenate--cysteine ligase
MGYAIADAFAETGAEVVLVSGPTTMQPENKTVQVVRVTSADEMFKACESRITHTDIAIFSAAVADFTPEEVAGRKVKRGAEDLVIRMKPTTDIAATLGAQKKPRQLFIGFALETHDGLEHAKEKLDRKNLDLIVLNSLEDQGAGFGTETNRVTMIDKKGRVEAFDLKKKHEVARDIVEKTINLLNDA